MNLFRLFFSTSEIELSAYPIAQGEEEYRVKREILSHIKSTSSGTSLDPAAECAPLFDQPKRQTSSATVKDGAAMRPS